MNGIDLLFVIVGLILLLVIWEITTFYLDWSEWDKNRRRDRQLSLGEKQDNIAEKAYRQNLRFIFNISYLTSTFDGFIKSMKKLNDSMKDFHKAFKDS